MSSCLLLYSQRFGRFVLRSSWPSTSVIIWYYRVKCFVKEDLCEIIWRLEKTTRNSLCRLWLTELKQSTLVDWIKRVRSQVPLEYLISYNSVSKLLTTTLNHLMVRIQFWTYGACGVHHCYYFHVHSDPG